MRVLCVCLLTLVFLAACASTPAAPTAHPTRVPVSPALAVTFALDTLHTGNFTGRLVGAPTVLRGQVMPLADAYRTVNGKPFPTDSAAFSRGDRLVWLVVTRGQWLLHIPGAHGDPLSRTPTIASKDIYVNDLWNALVFDGTTGEVFEQGGIPESRIPLVNALPPLTPP